MDKPIHQQKIVYRLADEKDLQQVYDLYMDSDANPYLTFDHMPIDAFKTIYKELLVSNSLYVAEINNEIIGTYRLVRKPARQEHIVYLGSFTVKNTMKGKGLGKELLTHIIEEAGSNGIKRIELTVDLHNEPAIHLYKKLGFEIEGIVRKSYYLKATGKYYDEYLMALIR